MNASSPSDIRIRGSGVVGCALALAASRAGFSVVLEKDGPQGAAPSGVHADTATQHGEHSADVRTYALNAASAALLSELRVWEAVPAACRTPVHEMHIQGDAQGMAAPGCLKFSAWQQQVEALAWIVDAGALELALQEALRFAPHVRIEPSQPVADARHMARGSTLLALCEGKDSQARSALGVGFDRQPYGHAALATRLLSSRPHANVALQWFNSPDVLALLPFDGVRGSADVSAGSGDAAGHGYGLVWSMPEERATELMQASPEAFEEQLNNACSNHASGFKVGALRLAGPRKTWPLMLGRADRLADPGWVLLGDNAHVVHPLAGQGLNLGLGDVICLMSVLKAREPWRSVGDEKLLARYARERMAPIEAMAKVTDGLWHLFSNPSPWAHALRNKGLTLLDALGGAKRMLARRALG